ncbi:MAG: hemerythrin domain-containing protein [Thermoplasmatota archaeon]
MKRHPAFQDLSRDHFTALLACLHVQRAVDGHESAPPYEDAVARLHTLWKTELVHHFDEEDQDLAPALERPGGDPFARRLASDHRNLRATFGALNPDSDPKDWNAAADALRVHVRWEEDELFEWMQDTLSEAELDALLEESIAFRTDVRGPDAVKTKRE